ncbi:hypothetical protein AWB77_00849 [Caballeronia fortuita]|uniref:Lipoprotein n=1 Tax=Caballeronia fortuita TaxID=1777138 RepID=A0A157ZKV4_9BURK|nr:hypothetical protein [Caballeronia fortuita]SAK45607.1 hypothetical protein AWB77_00849 [Caballeronia fortuita]
MYALLCAAAFGIALLLPPHVAFAYLGEGALSSSMPDHYYVGKKGNTYEYAKIPGDDVDAEHLVLVEYMGRNQHNEPVVRYQDGTSSGTLTCFDKCQFVRGATRVGGRLVQTGRIRITNDPLINAIMHDARMGRLVSQSTGKRGLPPQ